MYAVINEWENLNDHTCSGAEYDTYDELPDALHELSVALKLTIADYIEDHRNHKNVHDLWERYDLIEVKDEEDAQELFESGDYYDSDILFHWDTSMCEEVQ